MVSRSPTTTDDFVVRSNGLFKGGSYKISSDGPSAYLSVKLADDAPLYISPEAVVAKSGDIVYNRIFQFKLQKLLTDDPFFEYVLTGPGEVLLATPIWGDIIPIHLDGTNVWTVGRSGPLAMTDGVIKETRSQSIFRKILAREATFVYQVSGTGVVFVTALGAYQQRVLQKDEEWSVNNSSLVAWSCYYSLDNNENDRCMMCHFKGPGTVITQTQNTAALFNWYIYKSQAIKDDTEQRYREYYDQ